MKDFNLKLRIKLVLGMGRSGLFLVKQKD